MIAKKNWDNCFNWNSIAFEYCGVVLLERSVITIDRCERIMMMIVVFITSVNGIEEDRDFGRKNGENQGGVACKRGTNQAIYHCHTSCPRSEDGDYNGESGGVHHWT